MDSITFFSVSDSPKYDIFILPHILSILYYVENSFCEILILNKCKFIKENTEALKILDEKYGNRVLIRDIPKFYLETNFYYPHKGQIIRFIEVPHIKKKYTYIGDIDIIYLETDVIDIHKKLLKKQELPYSNIVRPNNTRLTGCMFLNTMTFYTKILPVLNKYKKNPKIYGVPLKNDEMLLYELVTSVFNKPKFNDPIYRPIHGLHISLNREPIGNRKLKKPGWGVNKKRITSFNKLKNSDIYKKMFKLFDPHFQQLIKKLPEHENEI